jgi:tetratricopeptide (TPR) repeat protein
MRARLNPVLVMALLLTVCFTLATWLAPRFELRESAGSQGLMGVLLGDSRRLFANHFFVKADEYFHSGYYPSIFDNQESFQTPHMAEDAGALKGKNTGEETAFMGQPLDFIESFSRNFIPNRHTHLDEGGASGEDLGEASNGQVREILPWLEFSAEMDPTRVETYTVGAFWLRRKMGKSTDAEQFLRKGLQANPGNPAILFELGRIYDEDYKQTNHARNIWEEGVANLDKQKESLSEQDTFIMSQLTLYLARLEETSGNLAASLHWLERLKPISPDPADIENQIGELKQKLAKSGQGAGSNTPVPPPRKD